MGPTQGPYILQLCMGPSYFGGSDPAWPPYFAHCGPINDSVRDFLINMGRQISVQSGDDREASFLF